VQAALVTLALPQGGWREPAGPEFQANAHMHLLEAALAWETLEPDGPWARMADVIVGLARARFIDDRDGFLREFFGPDWRPAEGEAGRLVEPGHQFEWAWLLTRWGRLRGDPWGLEAARRLFAVGERGLDPARGVALRPLGDGVYGGDLPLPVGGVPAMKLVAWRAADGAARFEPGPDRSPLLPGAAACVRDLLPLPLALPASGSGARPAPLATFVLTSDDGLLRVVDAAAPALVHTLAPPKGAGVLLSAALDPSLRYLGAVGGDGQLRLYEAGALLPPVGLSPQPLRAVSSGPLCADEPQQYEGADAAP
jgi:hypothetical protein